MPDPCKTEIAVMMRLPGVSTRSDVQPSWQSSPAVSKYDDFQEGPLSRHAASKFGGSSPLSAILPFCSFALFLINQIFVQGYLGQIQTLSCDQCIATKFHQLEKMILLSEHMKQL
jgi:hypothetical protein